MRVVAFTPVRLGSKRCPGKSVRDLGGRSLLSWAVEKVSSLGVENHVWCSDPWIHPLVPSTAKLTIRPVALDADDVIGINIYRAFAEAVPADAYLLYHVTSPFVQPKSYRAAMSALTDGSHDSAMSVTVARTFTWFRGLRLNFKEPRPRTQELEPLVLENSAFYAFGREELARGRRTGDRPLLVELSPLEGLDIDEEKDYDEAVRVVRGAFR